MSILHIVNKSPYDNNGLADCLKHCGAGDEIILIEDAVVASLANSAFAEQLSEKSIYVLTPDLEARALIDRMDPEHTQVSDKEFVELTLKHQSTVSWY